MTAFDAATGEILRTYEGTRRHPGDPSRRRHLYLLVDPGQPPVGLPGEDHQLQGDQPGQQRLGLVTGEPRAGHHGRRRRIRQDPLETRRAGRPLTLTVGDEPGLLPQRRGPGRPRSHNAAERSGPRPDPCRSKRAHRRLAAGRLLRRRRASSPTAPADRLRRRRRPSTCGPAR